MRVGLDGGAALFVQQGYHPVDLLAKGASMHTLSARWTMRFILPPRQFHSPAPETPWSYPLDDCCHQLSSFQGDSQRVRYRQQ
jgi:hypothetical protein